MMGLLRMHIVINVYHADLVAEWLGVPGLLTAAIHD